MKTFTITDRASKGITLFKHVNMNLLGIPVGQGITEDTKALPEGTVFKLHHIDVVDKTENGLVVAERIVREANRWDRRALLMIETQPGVGGEVSLFANTVREEWSPERKRVVRIPRAIEEAVGVDLHAFGDGETGRRFLVGMQPGSSFRICRTGDLHGAPPELVVLWNGRWDRRANEPEHWNEINLWGLSVYERRSPH